jgi:hypothetical protein
VHTTYAKPGNFKHNIGNGLPGGTTHIYLHAEIHCIAEFRTGSTWEWTQEKSVTDSVSLSILSRHRRRSERIAWIGNLYLEDDNQWTGYYY